MRAAVERLLPRSFTMKKTWLNDARHARDVDHNVVAIQSRLTGRLFPRGTRFRGCSSLAAVFAACAACSSAPPASTAGAPPRPAAPPPAATTVGAATRERIAAIRDELVTRTSAERRANGLPAVTRSVNLMAAAQLQADQMVAAGEMSHDLPKAAYPTLKDRIASVSYAWRAIAENIAEGHGSAAAALTSWMSSPGHRANILNASYTEMGAGLAYSRGGRPYWVQVFARPR